MDQTRPQRTARDRRDRYAAPRRPTQSPDAARALGRPTSCHRRHKSRHRQPTLPQPPHGRLSPLQGLPETWRVVPPGPRRPRPQRAAISCASLRSRNKRADEDRCSGVTGVERPLRGRPISNIYSRSDPVSPVAMGPDPVLSAGEGLRAEAAPRHEGGHGEIDQVEHVVALSPRRMRVITAPTNSNTAPVAASGTRTGAMSSAAGRIRPPPPEARALRWP
jgi:hypothetical protein